MIYAKVHNTMAQISGNNAQNLMQADSCTLKYRRLSSNTRELTQDHSLEDTSYSARHLSPNKDHTRSQSRICLSIQDSKRLGYQNLLFLLHENSNSSKILVYLSISLSIASTAVLCCLTAIVLSTVISIATSRYCSGN